MESKESERTTASGVAYVTRTVGRASCAVRPLLVFAHGCGLNAGAWRGVVDAIDDELRSRSAAAPAGCFDCALVDLPGHGETPAAAGGGRGGRGDFLAESDWARAADAVGDVVAAERARRGGEAADPRPVYGVGHSSGASALLRRDSVVNASRARARSVASPSSRAARVAGPVVRGGTAA
jgi:pimeloyl-ACP methyl ester carboxylesterase